MDLILNKPSVTVGGGFARLVCEVETETRKYPMFLEVEERFQKFLTYEVLDSQLICVLLYAMEHKMDIVCKGQLSERLYRQLTEYVIPAISRNIRKYHKVSIKCDGLSNENFGGKFVGTGLSCGVDSFYTILKNQNHSEQSGLNVNCLAFFNAGASGPYGGDASRRIFQERAKMFFEVAKELNCDFMTVDSNMNEFLHQNHEATHVFRTLSIPLALQKYFKLYYFSSTCEYKFFKFSSFDPSYYDIFTMPNLSTDSTRFELVGGETTRQGKVDFICDNPVVKKHLNVCVKESENCGKCTKCKRTMLNLMLAGKLEEYRDCFDLTHLKWKKRKLILWAITHKYLMDVPEICRMLRKRKLMNIFELFLNFICVGIFKKN